MVTYDGVSSDMFWGEQYFVIGLAPTSSHQYADLPTPLVADPEATAANTLRRAIHKTAGELACKSFFFCVFVFVLDCIDLPTHLFAFVSRAIEKEPCQSGQ